MEAVAPKGGTRYHGGGGQAEGLGGRFGAGGPGLAAPRTLYFTTPALHKPWSENFF